jgi:hypothetical protein
MAELELLEPEDAVPEPAAQPVRGRRPDPAEADHDRVPVPPQRTHRRGRYLEYVHPGPATARLAGTWRAAARRRGHVLSLADALIAATAYDLGAAVLTRNARDFALTPVRVETY